MSTQINQYLIYGIRLPYEWSHDWEEAANPNRLEWPEFKGFYETFEPYLDDSAYQPEWPQKDGITMLFDGRDGKWIFLGHCMAKAKDGDFLGENPIEINPNPLPGPVLDFMKTEIKRIFGVEGDWRIYVVTQLR